MGELNDSCDFVFAPTIFPIHPAEREKPKIHLRIIHINWQLIRDLQIFHKLVWIA